MFNQFWSLVDIAHTYLGAPKFMLRAPSSKLLASYPLLRCRVQIVPHFEVVSFDDVNLVRCLPGEGDVCENRRKDLFRQPRAHVESGEELFLEERRLPRIHELGGF